MPPIVREYRPTRGSITGALIPSRAASFLQQEKDIMKNFFHILGTALQCGAAASIAYASTTTQPGVEFTWHTLCVSFGVGFISGLGIKGIAVARDNHNSNTNDM